MGINPVNKYSTSNLLNNIQFSDIFELEEIQKLQDLFSDATGVASIITSPDGTPITRPSNFCKFCNDIIRKNDKGLQNCYKSDSIIGNLSTKGPIIQKCLSGGLWDSGASITVGGRHIANWLIGQVRNEEINENEMVQYADEIGINRDELIKALLEVPAMSIEQFTKVSEMLYAYVNQLSEKAYSNFLLQIQLQDSPNNLLVTNLVKDLNQRKTEERIRNQQLKFTKALNKIAEIIIINDSSEDLLENSNRIIGETLNLDRSLIYDVSFTRKTIIGLCEWIKTCDVAIEPTKGEYPIDLFRNSFNEVKTRQKYIESHENSIFVHFEKDGCGQLLHDVFKIKSLLWYPFAFYDDGFYLFTINQVLQTRSWTDDEIGFLESVAKQVSLALMKIRMLKEKRESQKSLIESEEKYRLIAENTSDGIMIFNPKNGIQYVSPSYLLQLGYEEKEEINRSTADIYGLIHKDDRDTLFSTIFNAIEHKKRDLIYFYRARHKNGHYIWREDNAKLKYDEEGNYIGAYVICRDITERKLFEQELIRAKNRAEESDKLKSAFLANMSHEIRTPMNGILGFAKLLKEPKLSGEEQQEFIKIIEDSGDRLLVIINDIINISKVESGQMEVCISDFNLHEELNYVYNFFSPETQKKGLKLICKIPFASIPRLKTDKDKIIAVLVNLVKNAIKFTKKGSIQFGYANMGKHIEFFVKDTGIGIQPAQQGLIFERFRQGSESLSRSYEGAGLGLSISKAYVNMLGGTIWVESTVGKGSKFSFTIPYEQ